MISMIFNTINSPRYIESTLWLFNIAMENGPFIDDFPIKTSIYKGFSMAMLVVTRGYHDLAMVLAIGYTKFWSTFYRVCILGLCIPKTCV